MKISEKVRAAFAKGFEGKLVLSGLEEPWRYYTCPCGGTNHLASRSKKASESPLLPDGFSPVLHCWETGKQWFLVESWEVTAGIIAIEERRYLKLLEKAPGVLARYMAKWDLGVGDKGELDQLSRQTKESSGEKMTHWEALHSTHGLDRETIQSILFGESGVRMGEERVSA